MDGTHCHPHQVAGATGNAPTNVLGSRIDPWYHWANRIAGLTCIQCRQTPYGSDGVVCLGRTSEERNAWM
jgi:hypothetical protein